MDNPTATAMAKGPSAPVARLRGCALCYFSPGTHSELESALTRHGMTVLRARNDLHAVSMARSVRPDVILMEIDHPAEPTHAFLTDLRGIRSCATIPVMAIVPTLQQETTSQTCLRHVTTTVVRDSPTERVVAEVAQLLARSDRMFRRDDAATASIDAVFSELGTRKRRRRISASSLWQPPNDAASPSPIQPTPSRIRRIDEQPEKQGILTRGPRPRSSTHLADPLDHAESYIHGGKSWVARPESSKGVAALASDSPRPSKTQGVPPAIPNPQAGND
jgi:DNA-binding NarL/FixJ family response regulator